MQRFAVMAKNGVLLKKKFDTVEAAVKRAEEVAKHMGKASVLEIVDVKVRAGEAVGCPECGGECACKSCGHVLQSGSINDPAPAKKKTDPPEVQQIDNQFLLLRQFARLLDGRSVGVTPKWQKAIQNFVRDVAKGEGIE